MKTKNIFRMLLVAAALLLGANNVKAALSEGENVVWQGSVQCNWGTGAVFSSSSFKNASSGNTVRIYGNFSTDWQTEFMVVNNGWQKFSIPEWGNENKAQASTTTVKSNGNGNYVEFELTTGNLPTIQAVNECVVQGINFTVTKVVIYVPANASISFGGNVALTFGDTFTPPTVTTTPENATVVYTSSNVNVAYISNNTVIPVGEGIATITGTIQGTNVSSTYTITVNAPTRNGAVWNGAVWLGNFGGEGGSQPRFSIQDYFSGAQSGGSIRFYGKIGPLSPTYWKLEIVDPKWTNPRLFAVDANDYTTKTVGGNGFADGYIDIPVDQVNLNSISYIILNGNNLTITAIQMIAPNASVKQDVTLTFSRSTATATLGESFTAPTLTAASANVEVTNLNITYTSSNTNVATVGRTTGAITLVGAGTTTITASFAGNETYNQASASYTLNVNQPELSDDDFIPVYGLDYGYRTYVTPQAIDFSRSVGVEGYYATGLNTAGDAVILIQITSVCPVDVPLLLKAKDGATEYKLLKSSVTTASAPTDNKLVAGRTENGQGIEVIGNNKYVLTVHSNEVVFAEVDNQAAQVDATHAYLDLNGTSTNARGRLSIKLSSQGINTGISSIESDEQSLNRVIYNIRGQRVENPTKGLYIINGKKVLLK